MRRDRNSFINAEYCYFDENFKRVKSFVMSTASIYHCPFTNRYFWQVYSVSNKTKKTSKFSGVYSLKPTTKCMVMRKSSSQLAGALTWHLETLFA